MPRRCRPAPLPKTILLGTNVFGGVVFGAIVLGTVGVLRPAAGDEAPKSELTPQRESAARTTLAGGQALVGKVLQDTVRIRTAYGDLTVPFKEVVRIRFGLALDEAGLARLRESIEALEKEGPDSDAGKAALEAVRELGEAAAPELKRRRGEVKNEAAREKLDEILDQLAANEDSYLESEDEVMTERFTVKGEILEESFRVESLVGVLEIPGRDIRQIAFRDIEIKKVFKIGVQHMEGQNGVLTGVKVRKGQRISLVPAGTMSYEGNSFGPAGLPNWRWNSRNMGCLQWRIGESGEWLILGVPFEGKVTASGMLQFCVHLHGGTAGGEFTVTMRTKAE